MGSGCASVSDHALVKVIYLDQHHGCFILIYCSLKAMEHVSVETVIVFANLNALVVLWGDRNFLRANVDLVTSKD